MPQKRMFCRRHIKLNLPVYVVEKKKIYTQLVLTLLAGIINVIPPSSFDP